MNTVTVCLRAEIIQTTNCDNASSSVTQTAPKKITLILLTGLKAQNLMRTLKNITLCVDLGAVREGWRNSLSLGCGCWHILLNRKLYLFFGVILVSSKNSAPLVSVSVRLSEHSHHPIP